MSSFGRDIQSDAERRMLKGSLYRVPEGTRCRSAIWTTISWGISEVGQSSEAEHDESSTSGGMEVASPRLSLLLT